MRTSPKRSSRRARKQSGGGAQSCQVCRLLVQYGINCNQCGRRFHDHCLLSLQGGTNRLCGACFGKQKGKGDSLDSHMHAPFSPENLVPFHPFTHRYARANGILEQHESGEEYKPSDDESGDKPTKRKLQLDSPAPISKKNRVHSGIRQRNLVAAPPPSPAQPPAQPPASQEGAADAASAVTNVNGAGAAAATSAVGDGDVSAQPPAQRPGSQEGAADAAQTPAQVPTSPEVPISKARNPPPPNSGVRQRNLVAAPPPSPAQPPAQPPAYQEGAADAASAVTDVNGAGAVAATSAVGDGDVSADDGAAPDDGIRLSPHVIKHPAVFQLEHNKAYDQMTRMSVNTRIELEKADQFREMRKVIRDAAKLARKAYVNAGKAEPQTPHVTDFLQVFLPCVRS